MFVVMWMLLHLHYYKILFEKVLKYQRVYSKIKMLDRNHCLWGCTDIITRCEKQKGLLN